MPKLDIALRIANNDYEYRAVLRDIGTRRYKNIILDLEPREAQIVLKMALQLGMINSTYHYVLTTLDIETIELDDFKYNRANITGLRLTKTETPFYRSVVLNLNQFMTQPQQHARYLHNKPPGSYFDASKLFLKTKNALLFDAIFVLTAIVKEAEKTLNLNEEGISCADNKPLTHGTMLSTFVEKVSPHLKKKRRKKSDSNDTWTCTSTRVLVYTAYT
jgi:ionotropic glutamate receptor